jgi:hypothetical protein
MWRFVLLIDCGLHKYERSEGMVGVNGVEGVKIMTCVML